MGDLFSLQQERDKDHQLLEMDGIKCDVNLTSNYLTATSLERQSPYFGFSHLIWIDGDSAKNNRYA